MDEGSGWVEDEAAGGRLIGRWSLWLEVKINRRIDYESDAEKNEPDPEPEQPPAKICVTLRL